jgi:hypothetical protein
MQAEDFIGFFQQFKVPDEKGRLNSYWPLIIEAQTLLIRMARKRG